MAGEWASSSRTSYFTPSPRPAAVTLSQRLEYQLPYTTEVLRALHDESINLIGIDCGKVRGGETVTTKEFIKRVKQQDLFEEVAMTVVSLNPNLRQIQGEIADMLGLNLGNESFAKRAKVLHARMIMDRRRLLLIFAGVCEMLDLEAIGIPYGTDANRRYKIIFMSGLLNVSSTDEMRAQSEFKSQKEPIDYEPRSLIAKNIREALADVRINPTGKTTLVKEVALRARAWHLFDEVLLAGTKRNFPWPIGASLKHEAWSWFREMAGSSIESPELRPVAEQVLRECSGLPIAILIVGRALQHKSKKVWDDALVQLRKASPANTPEISRKVELSYECLGSEEAKSFFLFCCIYPEGSEMPVYDLIKFGIGLKLCKGIDIDSKWEAGKCVETLIDILKSCFLLFDSGSEVGYVKMHHIVRRVGFSIAASKGWW